MITFLLIVHGLIAVALIGGITHQAVAAIWPSRKRDGFVASYRAVAGDTYTTANIVLYLVTAVLGAAIYPAYRLTVRTYLESARLNWANGSFELKEQFISIGAGLLPLYWVVWRRPLDPELRSARVAITVILCCIVWYGFLVGHVLNNIRGVFGQ